VSWLLQEQAQVTTNFEEATTTTTTTLAVGSQPKGYSVSACHQTTLAVKIA